jgi:hypothetical protein
MKVSKDDVYKILDDAGLKTEKEKRRFLEELESGVKPKHEVVKGGFVGSIGNTGR